MFKVFIYYSHLTPVSTVLGNYLVESMFFNGYLVTIFSMLINGLTEYLYQRLFVFKKSIDTMKVLKKNKESVANLLS